MTAYTLPMPNTKNQLRKLIERTQQTPQPIVFTSEETAEPVAVLVQSRVFDLLQKRERQLFFLRLRELECQLEHDKSSLITASDTQKFVNEFQSAARTLWDVCPEQQQGLCVTLVMASRRLSPDDITSEQIAALRVGLDLLRDDAPNASVVRQYHQRLFDCGLPPIMSGDKKLAQMYEDEL